MAGFTRKQLKQDKFVEGVGHRLEYFQEHRKTLIGAAVLIVAGIVGVTSWMGYQQRRDASARVALQEAVRLFHGTVTTEQRVGYITYATTGERMRRTTEALENVRDEYSGRNEGVGSLYYLALLEIEQDKLDEAQQLLEQAMSGSGVYSGLARLTLAQSLGRQGEIDAAREHYQYLIDHPSGVVSSDRAKLELGRLLVDHDPEAAKPLLEELIANPGPAAGAATAALREISEGS